MTLPLLWLDVETTGLEDDDQILEVACCLTTFEAPFERIDNGHFWSLVRPEPPFEVNDTVLMMHTKNRLWHEHASQPTLGVEQVERELVAWLGRIVHGSKVTLAGSGISHFDRQVLQRWMPKVAKRLTYYSFDVGVVRRWQEALGQPLPVRQGAHRAWPDVEEALEYARSLAVPVEPRFVCASCFAPIGKEPMISTGNRRWAHYPRCPNKVEDSLIDPTDGGSLA